MDTSTIYDMGSSLSEIINSSMGNLSRFVSESVRSTREEEIEWGLNVQKSGCIESRNLLVEKNLKLAVFVATRFAKDNPGMAKRLSFDDIIAYAVEGLIKSADRYDPESSNGARFGTYAYYWVYQTIQFGLESAAFQIRMSSENHSIIRLGHAAREILEKSGKKPTREAVYKRFREFNLPKKVDARINSPEKLFDLMDSEIRLASIIPSGQDDRLESTAYGEVPENLLPAGSLLEPDERLELEDNLEVFRRAVESIEDERVRSILCYRYGLFNYPKLSLREVGAIFGISAEAIRLSQNKALKLVKEALLSFGISKSTELPVLEYDES